MAKTIYVCEFCPLEFVVETVAEAHERTCKKNPAVDAFTDWWENELDEPNKLDLLNNAHSIARKAFVAGWLLRNKGK